MQYCLHDKPDMPWIDFNVDQIFIIESTGFFLSSKPPFGWLTSLLVSIFGCLKLLTIRFNLHAQTSLKSHEAGFRYYQPWFTIIYHHLPYFTIEKPMSHPMLRPRKDVGSTQAPRSSRTSAWRSSTEGAGMPLRRPGRWLITSNITWFHVFFPYMGNNHP